MSISLLIAEDDSDIREVLSFVLQIEGFDVRAAADGREAIKILEQFVPDVLLTDLNMPNINGIELIEYVRQNKSISDLPIIAMTANDLKLIEKAKMVGASIVMQKPVDHEVLMASIKWLAGNATHLRPSIPFGAQTECRLPL